MGGGGSAAAVAVSVTLSGSSGADSTSLLFQSRYYRYNLLQMGSNIQKGHERPPK